MLAMSTLGTNSTCTGACGAMSRNAITCSSSNTMSAGISRRMILWKMVGILGSVLVGSLSLPVGSWWLVVGGGARDAGRRRDSAPPTTNYPSSHLAARTERMRQRAAVDVFQLPAQRHAVREAARLHAVLPRKLGEV